MNAWLKRIGLLAVMGACLAGSPPAAAAQGDLKYEGCVADTAAQGCVDLPGEPLLQPRELAASPDGRSVYVVTRSGSFVHLTGDPATGKLSWGGCLQDVGARGCTDVPGAPLAFMGDVAVSSDGTSVYATSDRAVMRLVRAPDGQVAWDGCLAAGQGTGCGALSGTPLDNARALAVSPDGKGVYVAASILGSVAHFSSPLSYVGCLASEAAPPSGGNSGCGDLSGDPLRRAEAVAVSPDGRSVYVVAFVGAAIGHFARSTETGNLGWRGCLNNDGSNGCDNLTDAPLSGASAVELSPDGRSVYISSTSSQTISHLSRNVTTGELTWEGCLSNDGTNHCTDLPGAPLRGAMEDLAVSPDGKSVYATTAVGLVAHLARDPETGRLTWDGCYGEDDSEGCVDVPGPLTLANSVAVSADGRSVYVTSGDRNAVTHFRRELTGPAPAPPPATPPRGGPNVDRQAPTITNLTRRRVRARITFHYRLSEPAAVSVAIQRCRSRCRRWVAAGRALARTGTAGPNRLRLRAKLKPGTYRARFTATDAAGNRSKPATVRFRVTRARYRGR